MRQLEKYRFTAAVPGKLAHSLTTVCRWYGLANSVLGSIDFVFLAKKKRAPNKIKNTERWLGILFYPKVKNACVFGGFLMLSGVRVTSIDLPQ